MSAQHNTSARQSSEEVFKQQEVFKRRCFKKKRSICRAAHLAAPSAVVGALTNTITTRWLTVYVAIEPILICIALAVATAIK